MEIGVALDRSYGFSIGEYRQLARCAAQLGFASVWTNSVAGRDATQMCSQFWAASSQVVFGGLKTGIAVVPAPLWTVPSLACAAGTTAELTGGRFTLGIGCGSVRELTERRRSGQTTDTPLGLARDYLVTLRALLAGQEVTYDGPTVKLNRYQLEFQPPPTPVVLGALGPKMLRLAGEAADGAAMNWCTPETVAWARERVNEGAARAGRDPSEVTLTQYVRISVSDDVDAARRAFMRNLFRYAITRPGTPKHLGYRGHFGRLGFDAALSEIEERHARGETLEALLDAMPAALGRLVGYFGPADGAAAAFKRLSVGLDTALVRVIPAHPTVEAAAAVMEACSPPKILAA